jgi:hypothetical protein
MIEPFWGIGMRSVLAWCRDEGISYDGLPPSKFADKMDDLLGVEHNPRGDPETCANLWLKEIIRIQKGEKIVPRETLTNNPTT